MRDKSGRFMKGYSGNAGGRPKDEHNIAALARSYSMEAIETLVELMRNARDDRVRGTAAQAPPAGCGLAFRVAIPSSGDDPT